MIQHIFEFGFSHEFPVTSNKGRSTLLVVIFLLLASCSAVSGRTVHPGATPTIPAGGNATSTPPPQPTATFAPTFDPTITSTVALSTLTSTPTYTPSPSPTPFVTRPAPGQSASIPILMYHHLESLEPNASLLLRTWTVSPDNLGEQLDYLVAHDFHTITFSQLDSFFENGTFLPLHPVILTFDDGWSDDYNVAFPGLRGRGMVGTFFVPTAYAGAPGGKLLSWQQISEMDEAGMEFGGHTINHADLKTLSKDEALRQLQTSKSTMEEKLGHPTIAFDYPFGNYNADVIALVREVGYREAVSLCCGYKLRADNLLTLPRIRISYDDTLEDFVKKLPAS